MILRTRVGLLFVLIVCSCSQQPSKSGPQIENDPDQHIGLNSGLRIDNGINRGTDYTDSLGTKHNLRYIPITITNVSARPIHLHIAFSKEYDYPNPYNDEQFNVFPMPTEWGLDGVGITDAMITELLEYINNPLLIRTLEPGEHVVAAIGTRYLPTGRGIVPNALFVQSESAKWPACESHLNSDTSTESQLALGLKLDVYLAGHRDPVGCVLIPCGWISYPER